MVIKLKSFTVTLLLFLTSGCATNQPVPDSDTITCVHKYDDSLVIQYERKNISRLVVNGVVMFYILDVDGNKVFLNIHEIENYNCNDD